MCVRLLRQIEMKTSAALLRYAM